MKIRKATKKDSILLAGLWNEFEKSQDKLRKKEIKSFEKRISNPLNLMKKDIKDILNKTNHAIFIAEVEKKPIGYIDISIKRNPSLYFIKKFGRIHYIYVKKSFRKKGVASELIKIADKWFKKKGVKDITLSVLFNNKKAYNIYKKRGYIDKSISMYKRLK